MNGALDPLQPPVLQLPGAAALTHPRGARRVALNEGWAHSDSRKQDPVPKCHLAVEGQLKIRGSKAEIPYLRINPPLSLKTTTMTAEVRDSATRGARFCLMCGGQYYVSPDGIQQS